MSLGAQKDDNGLSAIQYIEDSGLCWQIGDMTWCKWII